jgi:peroxiredoxin
MNRVAAGCAVPVRYLGLLCGRTTDLADGRGLTHIQFRRFAGCPVCNLHLRSFVRRRAEVEALLREVVVFHSPAEDLAAHSRDIPFSLVADPAKALYMAYGVEAGPRALLDPRAWPTICRAVAAALPEVILARRPLPPLFPQGGRYGLPADFLVSADGIVLAARYGRHADDHWSVDAVLALAAARPSEGTQSGRPASPGHAAARSLP